MRGLMIVNPHATTTSARATEVIVTALSARLDLQVVATGHRGHARELGARARDEELDIVVTLGGDGTIHETVNGMLDGPPRAAAELPLLAPVPGGSANVIARALGLPTNPVEAAGEILEALQERRERIIGLGQVVATRDDGTVQPARWFCANAGLGIDAEIIAAMEDQRAQGRLATPGRYLRTTLRQFFTSTDRRDPALVLQRGDESPLEGVFLAIVQNTSPWTYLGSVPVNPCPHASFEAGLDVFAMRSLSILSALRTGRRMLAGSPAGSTRRSITVWHDQAEFGVHARRATLLQADGEGLGEVIQADFRSVPEALRTVSVATESPETG